MAERITSSEDSRRVALSFDIGGTFTDFVAVDVDSGEVVAQHKVLTNARFPARGVLRGWQDMAQAGLRGGDITYAVHSTTLVTNALIERKGALTVLLATRGFRDVLELARQQMYDIYDLFAPPPEPLIPRPLRLEIDERSDAAGQILLEPSPESIAAAVEVIRNSGATSVAIAFLHSYRNPTNEQLVARDVREALPEIAISISSTVAPVVGEYERTSTTAADAFTRPGVRDYLTELERALQDSGVTAPLFLMLSSGESASANTAREHPIRLLESGPAAGAMAAAYYGTLHGVADMLSLDMGGTTAKACVIEGGRPELAHVLEVARVRRFMAGSGLPVVTPVVDLIEIGAGGGSIARRDEIGLLRVGPDSAGADPGPACYGLGGTQPTVSDANLALGYLNPTNFLGGDIPLNRERAIAALGNLGSEMNLGADDIAWGIHRVVNENMAAAARVHIIERNRDPRDLTVIAFGGAGPAHAVPVARILGCRTVILPPGAGVASAFGALVTPVAFTAGRTRMLALHQADWDDLNATLSAIEAEARAEVRSAGVDDATAVVRRWADMRLEGQYHEISVDLPNGTLSAADLPQIQATFDAAYARQYGRVLTGLPIEALHWRVTVTGPDTSIGVHTQEVGDVDASAAITGEREARFHDGWQTTAIYDRAHLQAGMTFTGPAIIEEREATSVIGPGDEAVVATSGAIIVTLAGVATAAAAATGTEEQV